MLSRKTLNAQRKTVSCITGSTVSWALQVGAGLSQAQRWDESPALKFAYNQRS
jgi:hypothetical protein